MTDQSLVEQFIEIRRNTAGLQLWVKTIHWEGPHTPITVPTLAIQLSSQATEADVQEACSGLLKDPRFFLSCSVCGERKPRGWLGHLDHLSEPVCHGCMERQGVVF
jgi:hypothetical protein